jgi:hypothetical protein
MAAHQKRRYQAGSRSGVAFHGGMLWSWVELSWREKEASLSTMSSEGGDQNQSGKTSSIKPGTQ